ncbi:MAG: hypothetical protein K2H06_00805, partial [Anaeroplasmataceae bacterium]|nr:hypothetical protein [Anaeroplasmataceae bacterium]
ALSNNQISQIKKLDDIEYSVRFLRDKSMRNLIHHLKITKSNLLKLGFKQEEISDDLLQIAKLVQSLKVKNEYEELKEIASTILRMNESI